MMLLCLLAGAALTVGSTRELFLDDYLIASTANVSRVIHQARKHPANPVLWDAHMYGSVVRDGGRYRMWYMGEDGVRYAESGDGVAWRRPVDRALFSRKQFPYYYELFGVERDPRERDPARRYKMGYLSVDFNYHGPREDPFHPGNRRGLGVAASPDGIEWKVVSDWATEAICDGGTHWMYDARTGRYILYGRTKQIAPEVDRAWGLHGLPEMPLTAALHDFVKRTVWGRAVARVESPDLLRWDITEPGRAPVVMTADAREAPPGSEIYAMMVFPYESVYIGLVKVWHRTPEGGPLDIDLAVSRDSVHFTRVGDRSPFIPVGGTGEWDRFNNTVANSPPIVAGDELHFYYSGGTGRHSPYSGKDTGTAGSGIGLATIPRDRFVSLAASFDGGVVTTKPVRLSGRILHLNAKSDFGEIVVEALDEAGKTLAASKPVRRDGLDVPVELDPAAFGVPVVLRITLRNAHLFALWSN